MEERNLRKTYIGIVKSNKMDKTVVVAVETSEKNKTYGKIQKRTIIISIDQRAEGFHESNNIPIVRRNEIEKLEDKINGIINTDIIVDFDAINEFLGQFPEIKNRL